MHRERNDVNQSFLVIANCQDVATYGLLCVNLDFKGAPDVVREKADNLCHALPSLSIDNTDWHEDILANAELPLYPRKAFGMLVDPTATARSSVAEIVNAIDGGLRGRHQGIGTVLAEWEGVETDDLDGMLRHFEKSRVGQGWNEDYVLCVRESAVEARMVDIVNAKTQRCHTCPWETAGEILVWLFVGMIAEEELDEPGSVLQTFRAKYQEI